MHAFSASFLKGQTERCITRAVYYLFAVSFVDKQPSGQNGPATSVSAIHGQIARPLATVRAYVSYIEASRNARNTKLILV
jgi:hypothetical protein